MPQCYQSIIVETPIENVWDTVVNFHDMSWGSTIIKTCEAVGKNFGTEVGAKRILNGAFYETLLECNVDDFRIRYSVDDAPSPLSPNEVESYVGQIQLRPITLSESTSTFIEWSSSWKSTSDDAGDFCQKIYIALLRALANYVARQ